VTTLKRISLLLALGASLAAAGCGADDDGGKRIPAEQAQQLEAQLGIVEDRLGNGSPGACRDVLAAEDANDHAVNQILSTLPDDVDPDVRDALEQSFDNLWSLVDSRCQELQNEQPAQTETTPAPEPEPETTTTEPTETTDTTPPTDTVPPDEQEIPPDGDGENGGAIPEGNGNGGGIGPGSFKKEKKEKGE
jgi:hypothetical protein